MSVGICDRMPRWVAGIGECLSREGSVMWDWQWCVWLGDRVLRCGGGDALVRVCLGEGV